MLPSFPKDIRVKNLLPGVEGGTFAHVINWKKVNGVSNYNVYRSLLPYGDFQLIQSVTNEGTTDASQAIVYDSEPYYRISTVNWQGEGQLSEPQADENNLIYNTTNLTDKVPSGSKPHFLPGVNPLPSDFMRRWQFAQIRRRLIWQLEDIGEEVWLFKRKQPDPANPEDSREYGRNSDYYPPIKILVRMVSMAETRLMAEYGFRREKIPRSWTIWAIPLYNKDILIDRKNRRFEVQNVTEHYWKGLQISHIDFDMFLLPLTDDVYKNPQLKIEGNPL